MVYGLYSWKRSWRPGGGVTISLGQRKHGKGVGYEHTYHLHISITPSKQLMEPLNQGIIFFKTSLKALENIFFPPLKNLTKRRRTRR